MPPRDVLAALAGSGRAGVGLGAAVVVAVVALVTHFLDPLSLVITVGGPLAVTAMTFPRARLESAWRHVLAALDTEPGPADAIASLKRLASATRSSAAASRSRSSAGTRTSSSTCSRRRRAGRRPRARPRGTCS